MQLKEAFSKLTTSSVFEHFKKEHTDYYLAHAFIMEEGQQTVPWLFGFYSKKTDKIIVFEVADNVTQSPEDDVFKQKDAVLELSLEKTVPYEEAKEVALGYHKEKWANKVITKTISILQHIEEGIVWNITFVTQDFFLINVKMDAATKEIKHTSCDSILSLKQED